MLSSKRRFRPMGISDILDETIELYKSSFILLIGIAAIVYVPAFLVSAIIPQPKFSDPSQIPDLLSSQIPQLVMLFIMAVFLEPLVTGALTYAISEKYLSKETGIKECFVRVLRWRIFCPLVGASFIRYVLVLFSPIITGILAVIAMSKFASGVYSGTIEFVLALMLLLCIPVMLFVVLYFMLKFLLVTPAVVVEECATIRSLMRSCTLMRGSMMRAFTVMLIAFIIVMFLMITITGSTSFIMTVNLMQGQEPSRFVTILHTVLYTVVCTLTVPILSIVPILLYYDIRIRKEGFDLQVLADELDHKTREMSARDVSALPQEKLAPEQMGEGPIPDTQA